MKRKRLSLISASLLLAALIGGLAWTVYAPTHQERLNRALIAAIKKNDTKMALTLLAEGADPNARDEPPQHLSLWRLLWDRLRGKHPAPSKAPTALLVALTPRDGLFPPDHPPLIKALLDKGANPNVALQHGETPLLLAAMAGMWRVGGNRAQTIHLLLDHGADVNPPIDSHVLLYAVWGYSTNDEAIVSLLKCGAKIDTQDSYGDTPLMLAVQLRKVSVVKLLLAYHANPNIKNKEGDTPLSLAKRYHALSLPDKRLIIQMLKQAGAKK